MTVQTRALLFAACLTGLTGFAPVAAAGLIVSQKPCIGSNVFCVQFNAGQPIPTIRTVRFKAPSAGTAAVSFHGSLVCTNSSSGFRTIQLLAQIVRRNAEPASGRPGAIRYAKNLAGGTTTSFNLASMRVVNLDAGRETFRFKIDSQRMDPQTSCAVYDAVFTVEFEP